VLRQKEGVCCISIGALMRGDHDLSALGRPWPAKPTWSIVVPQCKMRHS
jgi:hypothetical protein